MCRATAIWGGRRGEWGVRRVAKGVSGWVLFVMGTLACIYHPLIIIQFPWPTCHPLFILSASYQGSPYVAQTSHAKISPFIISQIKQTVVVSPPFPLVLGTS